MLSPRRTLLSRQLNADVGNRLETHAPLTGLWAAPLPAFATLHTNAVPGVGAAGEGTHGTMAYGENNVAGTAVSAVAACSLLTLALLRADAR